MRIENVIITLEIPREATILKEVKFSGRTYIIFEKTTIYRGKAWVKECLKAILLTTLTLGFGLLDERLTNSWQAVFKGKLVTKGAIEKKLVPMEMLPKPVDLGEREKPKDIAKKELPPLPQIKKDLEELRDAIKHDLTLKGLCHIKQGKNAFYIQDQEAFTSYGRQGLSISLGKEGNCMINNSNKISPLQMQAAHALIEAVKAGLPDQFKASVLERIESGLHALRLASDGYRVVFIESGKPPEDKGHIFFFGTGYYRSSEPALENMVKALSKYAETGDLTQKIEKGQAEDPGAPQLPDVVRATFKESAQEEKPLKLTLKAMRDPVDGAKTPERQELANTIEKVLKFTALF